MQNYPRHSEADLVVKKKLKTKWNANNALKQIFGLLGELGRVLLFFKPMVQLHIYLYNSRTVVLCPAEHTPVFSIPRSVHTDLISTMATHTVMVILGKYIVLDLAAKERRGCHISVPWVQPEASLKMCSQYVHA